MNNPNTPKTQSPQTPPNTQNTPTTPTIPTPPHTFLPRHGHYRNLRVYKVTEIIYDITYYFTRKFLSRILEISIRKYKEKTSATTIILR